MPTARGRQCIPSSPRMLQGRFRGTGNDRRSGHDDYAGEGCGARRDRQFARLWCDSWQDAHAQCLPAELNRRRALESFWERLKAAF
jgi:hypothetical protein